MFFPQKSLELGFQNRWVRHVETPPGFLTIVAPNRHLGWVRDRVRFRVKVRVRVRAKQWTNV